MIEPAGNQVNITTANVQPITDDTVKAQTSGASNTELANSIKNTDEAEQTSNTVQTSISSRAQKLQKLAEEFFPGGPQTLKITPEFVQRLSDYQFISQEQLDSLPINLKTVDKDDQDSISQLIFNTESILEKLKSEAEFEGLFESLKSGVEQMEQFQAGGSQSFVKSSKLLANEIAAQFETVDKNALTQAESKTIEQMMLALNLTDKLNSGKTNDSTNNVINQYL